MPEGRCPKCGALFYGWALTEPENQTCPNCGTRLEIHQEKGEAEEIGGNRGPGCPTRR